jgi:hypothetical protein
MWAAHDDVYHKDYLQECVKVLESHPEVVLCQSRITIIDHNGEKLRDHTQDLRSDSPLTHVRFHDLITNIKCFEIFGLIRMDALRRTPLLGPYGHADGVLLTRLGLMGRFHEIPDFLFFNRDHPSKSLYAYSTYRDYAVFFEPTNAGRILLPRWRLGYEYFRSVGLFGLTWRERLLCYFQMGHWLSVYWKSLLANLAIAAAQILGRLLHVKKVVKKKAGPLPILSVSGVWLWFRS